METTYTKTKFQLMLKEFNDLVEGMPPVEKIKDKLIDLRTRASNTKEFTIRQVDAIADRVRYYLNGDYGNTKQNVPFPQQPTTKKA